ncbi:MAG TPA: hypothetical protein DIS84_08720 [Corynebacterium stationis]|nr:hypothetical protein [Corynebacterium stationis]
MQHQMHNWEMAEDMPMQRERDPWAISIPPVIIEERVHTQEHMLLWQVRGRTELVIDGAKVQLIDGQAVWIPAGAPHSLTVAANSVLLPLEFPISAIATTLDEVTVLASTERWGRRFWHFCSPKPRSLALRLTLHGRFSLLLNNAPWSAVMTAL